MTPASVLDRLSFRVAVRADAAAILPLVHSAYRGDESRRGWTTEADLLDGQRTDEDELVDLIARRESRILLAFLALSREPVGPGPRLVGCCHVEKRSDACYFGMFSVDPTLQAAGVGRSLLARAEQMARDEWRCVEMTMTVIDVRHELIAWYERRGYARTGEHKPFPYGDARSGIPRRADLRFEVLRKKL